MNKESHVSALHRAFAGSPSASAGVEGPRCRSRGAARGSRHRAAGTGQLARGSWHGAGGSLEHPGPAPRGA